MAYAVIDGQQKRISSTLVSKVGINRSSGKNKTLLIEDSNDNGAFIIDIQR